MNELYGVFKKFAGNNYHDAFTKMLNSAKITNDTAPTLRVLHDEFGHYSQLVIHNDVCYVCFQHNEGGVDDDEHAKNMTLTLATFPLERALSEDFDYKKDVSYTPFGKIGQKIGEHTLLSSTNANSMTLKDDKIYIVFTFESNIEMQWTTYVYVYDLQSLRFCDRHELCIDYGGEITPFNNDAINRIYLDNGIKAAPKDMIMASNRWSLYNGEYYTSVVIGSFTPNPGIIIKTKDFKTVKFVSAVPEGENTQAEIVSGLYDGKMYLAARQFWGTPYLLFYRYDIDKNEWIEPYKIEDGNSRPSIFEYKGKIYLYNTLEEPFPRRYSNISRIRTEQNAHNFRNAPTEPVCTLFKCGNHHHFFVYGDRIFFSCSNTARIYFGELKFREYSTDKVNKKLLELFGDECLE